MEKSFGRLLTLLVLMAGLTSATTLTVSSLDASRGQYGVWLKLDEVEQQEYYAGAINVTIDQTYSRTAFCIDLFTGITFADYDTDLSLPGADSRLKRIAWLIDNELPSVALASQGAGLQLAIWDIIHDSGDGLGAGRIQSATLNPTDSAVLAAANTFLSVSTGLGSQKGIVYVNTRDGIPAQRLISDTTPDNGPSPVPEASSLTLMLLGLTCVIAGAAPRKVLS